MNEYKYKIFPLKFLLIVSVAEAANVVEVHTLAEDMELEYYRSALIFLRTLME